MPRSFINKNLIISEELNIGDILSQKRSEKYILIGKALILLFKLPRRVCFLWNNHISFFLSATRLRNDSLGNYREGAILHPENSQAYLWCYAVRNASYIDKTLQLIQLCTKMNRMSFFLDQTLIRSIYFHFFSHLSSNRNSKKFLIEIIDRKVQMTFPH